MATGALAPAAVAPPSAAGRDPGYVMRAMIAIARGHWYRFKYRLLRKRFTAGRNLRVYGRLDVRGPGTVHIGDDTMVLEHCKLYTQTPDARLVFGSGTIMRSVHIDCAQEIVVGDQCQFAMSYVADTDSHSTRADRHSPAAPVRVAPVRIGDNVWIAQFSVVLPGANIARNSVLGALSVCSRAYPPNSILVGNPARVVGVVEGAEDSGSEVV